MGSRHFEGIRDMSHTTLERAQLHTRLKAFFEQHRDEYGLRTLGYFGSYARGEPGVASGIDIVFDSDGPNLLLAAMFKTGPGRVAWPPGRCSAATRDGQ